jgi:hypothetical protein
VAVEIDTALPIGLLAILGNTNDQPNRSQMHTRGGNRSDSRLNNGTIILSVSGASDVDRRGESAVLNTLLTIHFDRGLGPNRRHGLSWSPWCFDLFLIYAGRGVS